MAELPLCVVAEQNAASSGKFQRERKIKIRNFGSLSQFRLCAVRAFLNIRFCASLTCRVGLFAPTSRPIPEFGSARADFLRGSWNGNTHRCRPRLSRGMRRLRRYGRADHARSLGGFDRKAWVLRLGGNHVPSSHRAAERPSCFHTNCAATVTTSVMTATASPISNAMSRMLPRLITNPQQRTLLGELTGLRTNGLSGYRLLLNVRQPVEIF